MTQYRNILAAGLIAAFTLMAGAAHALNADEFTIRINIANNASLLILQSDDVTDRNQYDFGDLLYGDVTVSTATGINSEIRIDNNSGGLRQTYDLSIFDTAADGINIRTDSAALLPDEFRVSALCHNVRPTASDFGANDILTATGVSAQNNAGGIFSVDGSTPDGDDCQQITDGGGVETNLWLKLELATSGTASGAKDPVATIYIVANIN